MSRQSSSGRGPSHNRAWLWGRHAVMETLRAGRWIPLEIAIAQRCPADIAWEVRQCAKRHDITLIEEDDTALTKRCRSEEHQGLAVRLPKFPYADFETLCLNVGHHETWLVLDRIHDSHNFGAIVRSAAGLGVSAVLVGGTEQAEVNRQVVQSSAGAVNLVPITRVASLHDAIDHLRNQGVRVVAASEKADHELFSADLRTPIAIIVGNEGRGVDPALMAKCTQHVRIPMGNRLGSLNAAVAAGIVCYEALRQRQSRPLT